MRSVKPTVLVCSALLFGLAHSAVAQTEGEVPRSFSMALTGPPSSFDPAAVFAW